MVEKLINQLNPDEGAVCINAPTGQSATDDLPPAGPARSAEKIVAVDVLAKQERFPRLPRALKQPLAVIDVPGARLRLETVCAIVGLGRSAVYVRIAARTFPAPVRDGARCSRWRSDDIRAWLQAQ